MDRFDEFLLEDVRCFRGEQRAKLRPITLLVGENSTGKTSFLGCYSVLHNLLTGFPSPTLSLDFNREPFLMGSFRDIVRLQLGRAGLKDKFRLGVSIIPSEDRGIHPYSIRISFLEENGQPVFHSVQYDFGDGQFLILTRGDDNSGMVISGPRFKIQTEYQLDEMWPIYLNFIANKMFREKSEPTEAEKEAAEYISNILFKDGKKSQNKRDFSNWINYFPELIPVAPLRSKPKRTYNPTKEVASPEGEHIPLLLMRLARTNKREWNSLHDSLVSFGKVSGLFSDISVTKHGKQINDPFQLKIKARSGSRSNIVDVGYGVSQSLPILVDVRSNKNSTFLLQQPEVHLHPRAQAELSTMLAESYKEDSNTFIVETHSDYVIDRLRILVRAQKLNPSDVGILYFEPKHNNVNVHNLELDRDGNFIRTPPSYRNFFIRESDLLLGFED